MKEILTAAFTEAARDYFWLQDKEYPQRLVFKIVCDRYRLDRFQRVIIYRGIFPSRENIARLRGQTDSAEGMNLVVDTTNVVFRLNNYLCGRPVFISSDGLLRDAGDAFEKHFPPDIHKRSIHLLISLMNTIHPKSVKFLIDSPADGSELIESELEAAGKEFGYPATIETTYPADRGMNGSSPCIIATADSEVIDNLSCPCIDLPRLILAKEFSPTFLSIPEILGIPAIIP